MEKENSVNNNPKNSDTEDNSTVENIISDSPTNKHNLNKDEDSVGIEHIVENVDNDDTVGDDYEVDNDVVVDVDDDRGLVEQGENVVVWHVDGLYDDKGKLFKPRHLEKSPPVLILSDSEGNEASFLLTKNLSFHLYRGMESVYKSYFGIASKSVHETDSSWKRKKIIPFVIIGVLIVVALLISQFT